MNELGYSVLVIEPSQFKTFMFPGDKEYVAHALFPYNKISEMIRQFDPDYIHIATEGSLGWAARKFCLKHGRRFTTAFHTMYAEYVQKRYGIPLNWTYAFLRKFHSPASCVMVATQSVKSLLLKNGFTNVFGKWSRGADLELFNPKHGTPYQGNLTQYALYVGRVSKEKNIEAFLNAKTPGLFKIVVGDGPQLEELKKKYKEVVFVGTKTGEELAHYYANAAVFVFPSKTDTFGLVMIEAMASGTPVAGFAIPSPIDVVWQGVTGFLHDNLEWAIRDAQTCDRNMCRQHVEDSFTWDIATKQFISNLVRI